jgi:hypothetical protein
MAVALGGAVLASEQERKQLHLSVGASLAWAAAQALNCRMATEQPSWSPPKVRKLQHWRARQQVSGASRESWSRDRPRTLRSAACLHQTVVIARPSPLRASIAPRPCALRAAHPPTRWLRILCSLL